MKAKSFSLKGAIDTVSARIAERKAAEGENPPWVKQVAMLTGVLAAISGYLTVRSTNLTNDAIYMSNRAILAQTQASDAWAEYQANSVKARVVETAILTAPQTGSRNALEDEDKTLRARQPALQAAAKGKEGERDGDLKDSGSILAERDMLSYAGFAAQIAIALASVAALIRSRNVFYAGILTGVGSVLVLAYAFAMHAGLAPQ